MEIVTQYWGIVALIVFIGGYVVTHKKLAINYAKKKINKFMLAAEKGAEQLFLNSGQAKLQWVIDKGYDLMPPLVRLFIGKPIFAILAQSLFNEAKSIIESHKANVATIVPTVIAESIAPVAQTETL